MAELPVKARGVRSCSSPTSTLPSRLSSGSSDGEEEVCWICLSHRGHEVRSPGLLFRPNKSGLAKATNLRCASVIVQPAGWVSLGLQTKRS
jgi:hypothetical protein